MKLRITAVAMALSVFAVGPVFAAGAGGSCDYGSAYRTTSVEPQEQSEAAKKLASLSAPLVAQEAAVSAPEKSDASPSDQKTTVQ